MTVIKSIVATCLLVVLTGCNAGGGSPAGTTEWGYQKLPYGEWKFLFIYPRALPALATRALMVDATGYATAFRYLDATRPSRVSVGGWNERLGVTRSYYNRVKALPLVLQFCWDSVIDKKSYETKVVFNGGTREQMTTLYNNSHRPGEQYYRDTMIIGLAPGGRVSVWLDNMSDPVVAQTDAAIVTVSGEEMDMCRGVTEHPEGYVYYGDTPEFIKGKTYPYGSW